MSELISVIVPVYSVEKNVFKACVNSILEQKYDNLEIILIDDGSPDESGLICDKYKKIDSRIKVIHTLNGGVSSARNHGLNQCTGKYVTFIDSDDFVSPTYISNLYHAIVSNQSDCSMCGCKMIHGIEEINIQKNYASKNVSGIEALNDLFYMNHPFKKIEMTAVWGTLYSFEYISNIRFNTNMNLGEDFAFKYEFFKRIKKITYIDTMDYGYLIRECSIMHQSFDKSKTRIVQCLEDMIENSKKEPDFIQKGVISRGINIALILFLMIPLNNPKYNNESKKIKKFIIKHRKNALRNNKTRIKVKVALFISYISFSAMKCMFDLFQNFQNIIDKMKY